MTRNGTEGSGFPEATLDDVAESIVDGPFGSNLKTSDYVESGVPVLQGKNITGDRFVWKEIRYITERKASQLKRSAAVVGDHLLIKIGSIGYSAIVDDLNGHDHAIIPANLARLRPNRRLVDDRYLHRVLTSESMARHFRSVASKTAQPALSLKKIKATPIPLPPLAEQKRIAGILDAADALRAKRREALAQLDTLLQATFLDLFGDPVTNPKGWARASFQDVVYFQEGPGVRNWQFRDAGIKLINVRNIIDGELDLENTERHLDPHEVEEKYSHFLLDDGDLVMSSSGVTWGKIAYVRRQHLPLCLNTSMIRLRPANGKVVHSFIKAFVQSESFRRQILRLITGSAQPNFGPSHLRKLEIGLPPLDVQQRFQSMVASIDLQRATHRAHLSELDTLFASLQSRAFRGEL